MAGDVISDMKTLLAAAAPAGGVWYAQRTKQPAAGEYIVFQRIVSATNNTLDGRSNLQPYWFQVDIYATQMPRAVELEAAVLASLNAAPFSCVLMSLQDLPEPDTGLFRLRRDFGVWHT